MPLPKRVVEPWHVARGTLIGGDPPSELEAVTNGTLANAIRQLSSLSRHAEDMFGELARDSRGIAARASSLQARINRIEAKLNQLDSNIEEGINKFMIILIYLVYFNLTFLGVSYLPYHLTHLCHHS